MRRALSFLIAWVLPLAVLGGTVLLVQSMLEKPPRAKKRQKEARATYVEVQRAQIGEAPIVVEGIGIVRPSADVELRPLVSGRVGWISPRLQPGEMLDSIEEIVRIEDKDYALALDRAKAELNAAKARVRVASRGLAGSERDLEIERGNQSVAAKELDLYKNELSANITEANRRLILREPHLAAAEAQVEGARAEIASAKASVSAARAARDAAALDLRRTSVYAPMSCVVDERLVDLGEIVGPSTPLARLIGTERFWVEVAVAERDLQWLRFPDAEGGLGSDVELRNSAAWTGDAVRTGHVLRVLPKVGQRGRMAAVLVAVDDPLARLPANAGAPELLVGSALEAAIVGPTIGNAVAVAREWVREGDTVWVMTEDDALTIRELEIVHRSVDSVLVRSGVAVGERIVTSNLRTPVEGMPLRTESKPSETTQRAP